MTATNDFLVFAGSGGANVISQSTYASLAALGPGFSAGIALSDQLNKVWRQGSQAAYVLGQLAADVTGNNSVDDGVGTALLNSIMTCFGAAEYSLDLSGSANIYQVTFTPVMGVQDGTKVRFQPANTNTAASTFSCNGSTAHAIVDSYHRALVGGEIQANGECTVQWSATATKWILIQNSSPTMIGCSMYLSGHQETGTAVLFTGTFYNDGNYAAGTGLYTAPKTGLYLVGGQLRVTNSTGGGSAWLGYVEVNSSAVYDIDGDTTFTSTGRVSVPVGATVLALTAGQTVGITAASALTSGLYLDEYSTFSVVLLNQ